MNAQDRAEALTRAVIEQLNAEIAAKGQTVKSVAILLGRDYNTYRRYLTGERPLTTSTLWATLEALGVDEAVFMRRARERYESR